MTQQPEAVENYIQQAITTERREWNKLTRELYAQIDTLTDQLTTATRQKDEAIDTLATAMQQLTATQEENQALKETIATNERCYNLQLEAVTNDRAHLKALLDRATDERYELHNSLIETSARLNKELSQAIAYSDTVKKSLFAVMEQRDQISDMLNAERIARQSLAQLLKATN